MSWIDRIEFALENTSFETLNADWLKKKLLLRIGKINSNC